MGKKELRLAKKLKLLKKKRIRSEGLASIRKKIRSEREGIRKSGEGGGATDFGSAVGTLGRTFRSVGGSALKGFKGFSREFQSSQGVKDLFQDDFKTKKRSKKVKKGNQFNGGFDFSSFDKDKS